MELSVYSIDGKATSSKVKLEPSVFEIEPNEHAVYLDVKSYLASQRQGTHKAKERSELSGSTRKLFKQKGTGGARHGSIKAGIYVGGARIFGPRPRDYGFKLNIKTKTLARKSVLSSKAKDKQITVLEDFTFETPKTKAYLEMLNAFSLTDKKTLLILSDLDKNVVLSGRNIPNANIVTSTNFNTYELINNDVILISKSAVTKLNELQ